MSLIADIFPLVITHLVPTGRDTVSPSLLTLASTSRLVRQACLPFLFAEVRWPQKHKTDRDNDLLFYPESLWPYIRHVIFSHLRLDWHDEWTEPGRIRHGYLDRDGIYCPYHMELVISALARMPKLAKVTLSTPFLPPQALYEALGQCCSLSSFALIDTPIDQSLMQFFPVPLRRVNLTPVGQTLRIGDGPTDPKFSEITYFMRDWRRKYRAQANLRGLRELRSSGVFLRQHAPTLTHLELSGDLTAYTGLATINWPALRTFVLHGRIPSLIVNISFQIGAATRQTPRLFDVLHRMPALRDFRLLFPQSRAQEYRFLDPYILADPENLAKLASLESFAISNACALNGVFNYMPNLRRLAIMALVDLPRWPIALSQPQVESVLADIGASNCPLKHLRIIIEDKLTPSICHLIATHCPQLEILEIERCGYHDGKSVASCDTDPGNVVFTLHRTQQEYLEALSPLSSLRDLRLCMQFPEYDEIDNMESWRVVRHEWAAFFARGLKSLRKVGFEYRKRTGTHRYQDAWLDYAISEDGEIRLSALPPMWYSFPEVWEPEEIRF
ncbi:hypothetical protein EV363DRAFT_1162912 [Boletus edulis]|nr:hypothetical protein EV363DRAFT_1162912 [Boletus edulis]